MRSSGVLRRAGDDGQIVQFVWSFVVPNEFVPALVEHLGVPGDSK